METSPLANFLSLRLTPIVVEAILAEAATETHLEEHRGWETVGPDFVDQLRQRFTEGYKFHTGDPHISDSIFHFLLSIMSSCETGFLRPSNNRTLAILASSVMLTQPGKPTFFLYYGLRSLFQLAVENRGELTFVIMSHLLWRAKWKPGRAMTLTVYAAVMDYMIVLPMAGYFRGGPLQLEDELHDMGVSSFRKYMRSLRRRQSERSQRILVDGFQLLPVRATSRVVKQRRRPVKRSST
jgi:hypothetical protein